MGLNASTEFELSRLARLIFNTAVIDGHTSSGCAMLAQIPVSRQAMIGSYMMHYAIEANRQFDYNRFLKEYTR